ncbi:MAG TPA: GNAT family N-acetyltransferase, partial [Acidimicrobiia bacterium]|nr:GNAT family N-acetyltransferase [Acidimicrobiia bacterium]
MVAVPSPSSSLSSSFAIRRAVAGDFDAYMDAFEAVAGEGRWLGAEAPVDRETRRAGFDRAVAGDGAVLFVADAGGEIVGSVSSALSGGVADLGMLVVESHRGAGVGRALLEAVIDWARQAGAHKISLAAWPTNHPAIGLYARYGFRVEGTRRRHYRRRSGALWDSVVMGLVLDENSVGGPGRDSGARAPIVVPEAGIVARVDGVVLRPWRRADVVTLVGLIDDPEVRRWLSVIPDPYTVDDAEEYIAGTRVELNAGTGVALAIVADGRLAGSVGLRLDTLDGGTAEIGYWVTPAARGRGVASAAARLLSDFGLGPLRLRRVELNAAVGNTASCRVA